LVIMVKNVMNVLEDLKVLVLVMENALVQEKKLGVVNAVVKLDGKENFVLNVQMDILYNKIIVFTKTLPEPSVEERLLIRKSQRFCVRF